MNSRVLMLLFFICVSCRSEYDQLVRSELETGERNENLLFDFKFNQSRQEFYDQCWVMNRDTVISQGPKNEYAMYILEPGMVREENDKIEMLFYGIFDEDKVMRGMDIRFSYPKWSTWSEEYHSDKLIPKLQNYFNDEFPGDEFITVPLKSVDQNSYVKVDKNRQVLIYAKDSKDVVVKIEDIEYKLQEVERDEN